MIATSEDAYSRVRGKSSRSKTRHYSAEEIQQIVDSGDPVSRAALSEYFFLTNGLYKRIIVHYATFLTYSWILIPDLKKRTYKITDTKIANQYYAAADFCTGFQIERKCTLFAKDILVRGAYYGLIHDTDSAVVIQDLPFEYCRCRFKNRDDIDIIEFDMEFFDTIRDEKIKKAILETYPKVI